MVTFDTVLYFLPQPQHAVLYFMPQLHHTVLYFIPQLQHTVLYFIAQLRFNSHPRAEPVFYKRLRSPGIDSEESIPPAYVAWWVGTSNRVVVPARQAGLLRRFKNSGSALRISPPCLTSRSNAASPYTLPTPCKDPHAITSHLLATF
jgi:hypothetical protein